MADDILELTRILQLFTNCTNQKSFTKDIKSYKRLAWLEDGQLKSNNIVRHFVVVCSKYHLPTKDLITTVNVTHVPSVSRNRSVLN
jgi:hypothetical protein